jgi:uncharacterized protein YndB with AHSA1/START domain
VWGALAEGEQLRNWFPLDARVNPGPGGSVWLSWGEGADWEAPIEIWEPPHHMRTIDPAPSKLAVDYFIESRGGETVLRVVHSGFGADAWEDELETLDGGWRAFLATLKNYLERHRGESRTLAHFRHPVVAISRQDAFKRVLNAFGFDAERIPRSGERYDVTTRLGDHLQGTIDVSKHGINLSGRVENWNSGFLTIEIEPGRGQCRPAIWFSLYGAAGSEAPALEARLKELLNDAFAVV